MSSAPAKVGIQVGRFFVSYARSDGAKGYVLELGPTAGQPHTIEIELTPAEWIELHQVVTSVGTALAAHDRDIDIDDGA